MAEPRTKFRPAVFWRGDGKKVVEENGGRDAAGNNMSPVSTTLEDMLWEPEWKALVTEARIGHLCRELELSRKPSVRM